MPAKDYFPWFGASVYSPLIATRYSKIELNHGAATVSYDTRKWGKLEKVNEDESTHVPQRAARKLA